jgi:predicted GNAT family acetyltransferase
VHVLDRPVWASLSTHHIPRSIGNEHARRFARDVNVFASARDDSPEALAALADLLEPEETVLIAQAAPVVVPPGMKVERADLGVQMLATRTLDADDSDDIVTLKDADAPEMLALATLTKPGPFLTRTNTMGHFIGLRIDGRIAAMAGERMRLPGYTEVSGVCVHPDFRGMGLARRLSATVAARIVGRGDQPFLHAWKGNDAAISLYRTLGFELRTEMNVVTLKKVASSS